MTRLLAIILTLSNMLYPQMQMYPLPFMM